ncbi:hypothetical protein [Sphingobacterium sp. HSC-15S19]
MQKRFTILIILLAQIIVLGHGLFAHHHHEEAEIFQHIRGGEVNTGKVDIGHLFSGIQHTGDQITYTSYDNSDLKSAKDTVKIFLATVPDYRMYWEYTIVFLQHTFPPEGHIAYQSPLHCGYSLRGPPMFIVA